MKSGFNREAEDLEFLYSVAASVLSYKSATGIFPNVTIDFGDKIMEWDRIGFIVKDRPRVLFSHQDDHRSGIGSISSYTPWWERPASDRGYMVTSD